MTQLQLAEAAGMSLDAIGALEREVNVPTVETAAKLIAALDIDPGSVFPSQAVPRSVSAARRDIEAEIKRLAEGMDDRGAALLLELANAVAKVHPARALKPES